MKVYAASVHAGPLNDSLYPYVLASFGIEPDLKSLRSLAYRPTSLLIDSGAWSAWTIGTRIDVDEYAEWALGVIADPPADDVRFISLDVIPGTRDGGPPTTRQRNAAMRESLRNGDRLRDAGVPIIEVFHQGEPVAHLDALRERRRRGELLGLSPRKNVPFATRREFLDACFSHLIRRRRVPPTHGFGVATVPLYRRYPWWSCDSTSWRVTQTYGTKFSRMGTQRRVWPVGELPPERLKIARVEEARTFNLWRRIERETAAAWERRGIRHLS